MGAAIDLTGRVFGRLTVVSHVESRRFRCGSVKRYWRCVCACGLTAVVGSGSLRSGRAESCGCLQRERASGANIRHGHFIGVDGAAWRSATYRSWRAMLTRCTNPGQKSWKNYGGRGIRVCARWATSFEAFLADMGPRLDGTTIERVNNAGDYEPGNCRWATRAEQARNSRANRLLCVDGETAPIAAWSERFGVAARTIRARVERGWEPKLAVSRAIARARQSERAA